jgi:4-carboxymuconolactone decarboxylase
MKPRLDPPTAASISPEVSELLALAVSADGATIGTIAVLGHRPPLLGPFLGWAAALARQGALSPRHHELLALRTSFRCGSSFEWGEHAGYAHQAGLSHDEIDRVARIGDLSGWAPGEAALLRAADELCAGCAMSEAVWAELALRFDTPTLVEIPFVVGQYTMLSMVANALGVPSSPGAPSLPPES